MRISILTLFPEMFEGILHQSILKRAQGKKVVKIDCINIRDFGIGRHKIVDDTPYGGGVGMVMRVDVIKQALDHARCKKKCNEKVFLLDAQGKTYNQKEAKRLSNLEHLILICGHYEGVDERVRKIVDEEISIGDYILTGGEIPAMVIVDSVVRLIPGVIKEESTLHESFSPLISHFSSLEYPQYTKPPVFEKEKVPKVLLSGNHKEIKDWRSKLAIAKTKKRRPDLLAKS